MIRIFSNAAKRWWNSDPATHGAAIAYYALFSIAPLFIIMIIGLGSVFGREAVAGKLLRGIAGFVGRDVTDIVQNLTSYSLQSFSGTVATTITIIVIIYGALALFSQVQRSLWEIWSEDAAHMPRTFIRTKIIAVLMVVVLGLMIIFSFAASGAASVLFSRFDEASVSLGLLISNINRGISLAYIFLLFACMYKYLPDTKVSWRASLIGASVAGLLFIIGRELLSWYITATVASSVYGTAGTAILVFFWFYYSALIFFFGGAVTFAVDQEEKMGETRL